MVAAPVEGVGLTSCLVTIVSPVFSLYREGRILRAVSEWNREATIPVPRCTGVGRLVFFSRWCYCMYVLLVGNSSIRSVLARGTG